MAKDTVQKIKDAARKIFSQKGFSDTRTKDISDEAGVNIALINYHFGSKSQLFSIVMSENMDNLRDKFARYMNDASTDLREKLILIADSNAQLLIANNDLVSFVLNTMYKRPEYVHEFLQPFYADQQKVFGRQAKEMGFSEYEISQVVIDLLSLIICPLVGKPLVTRFYQFKDAEFNAMLESRRKQIPLWVDSLLAMKREV